MTISTPHQLCNSRVERVVRKVTEGTLCITNCNLVVVVLGDFVLLLSQERHRPLHGRNCYVQIPIRLHVANEAQVDFLPLPQPDVHKFDSKRPSRISLQDRFITGYECFHAEHVDGWVRVI